MKATPTQRIYFMNFNSGYKFSIILWSVSLVEGSSATDCDSDAKSLFFCEDERHSDICYRPCVFSAEFFGSFGAAFGNFRHLETATAGRARSSSWEVCEYVICMQGQENAHLSAYLSYRSTRRSGPIGGGASQSARQFHC